jgi:hypothetical protein
MSFIRKGLFLLLSLSFFIFSGGCVPTKQARVAAATFKQSDPAIVRAGTPAYLMLIDGLIEAYPDNSELLTAGCQAYTGYASSFVEDENREEAAALYARAKQYGFRALSQKRDFQQVASGSLDEFIIFLKLYRRQDVPALFWTTSAWGKWISLNLDSVEALADMPMLEATMRRVLELDDAFYYGGPHLIMAVYLAVKPEIVGGNISKAKEHFANSFRPRCYSPDIMPPEWATERFSKRPSKKWWLPLQTRSRS